MFFQTYIVALVVFFAIDMLWLGFIAKKFYAKHLGYLMADKVNWGAAITFYLLFILGLVVFVIQPVIGTGAWILALGYGALFGLVSYATYDLTNQATIKNWPRIITIVDLVWGTFLGAMVSVITHAIISSGTL